MRLEISLPQAEIAAFCRRHGIQRLDVFGSILTDAFDDESDIDFVLDFLPGRTPGLSFFAIADELNAIVGRDVDLLTRASVEKSDNFIFRQDVLSRTQTVYDAS